MDSTWFDRLTRMAAAPAHSRRTLAAAIGGAFGGVVVPGLARRASAGGVCGKGHKCHGGCCPKRGPVCCKNYCCRKGFKCCGNKKCCK